MKTSVTIYQNAYKASGVFGYEPKPNFNLRMCRRFVAYFFFVGWDCISLGLHVSLLSPNLEVHVPFGFFRIGWMMRP
jgi:hypothetical protein